MTVLPHQQKGKTVVLDLGANVDCDSTMLAQFAVMGSVLAEDVVGIKNPRVALLNIGEEETKGPTAFAKLLKCSNRFPPSTILVISKPMSC